MSYKRILALSLAAILTVSATACSSQEPTSEVQTEAADNSVPVQVEPVVMDDIHTEHKVSGKVMADDEHTIMVASSVKCTAVQVEAGDYVQAGDVICTLDMIATRASYDAACISYQSAIRTYENQKEILREQIRIATDNAENVKELFAIGAASQLEVDNAQLSLQQAIAGRDSALAQLEAGIQSGKSAVEQLSTVMENVDRNGNIVAPASGVLVTLNAVENGFVSTAVPVAVINGLDQMKICVSVAETLVPKLAIGDRVEVSVSSAGKSFEGVIRSVEKAANAQTKLYTVTVAVPEAQEGLLSGMSADVTFYTDSVHGVVIPTQAILTDGSEQYVFVVEEDTAKYIPVDVGLTGDGVTEITSGLEEGQMLVTVGQSYLEDGALVRVVSAED